MTTCPKCGYVRRTTDVAPAWQCPSCGIAYKKYKAYLAKVQSHVVPRTAETGSAPVGLDGSVWSLVLANVFTLLVAALMGWQLVDLMIVYWIQSVIIGLSYVARIMSLERYSTKDFKMNGHSVEPNAGTKAQVAIFFAFHFGFFHFIYLVFLFSGEYGDLMLGWDLFVCAGAFAANHIYSYRFHRDLDREGTPNIGELMFTPYIRIVPMHLTIIFGGMLASSGVGIFLFGMLKSVADVVMHQVEHSRIARK